MLTSVVFLVPGGIVRSEIAGHVDQAKLRVGLNQLWNQALGFVVGKSREDDVHSGAAVLAFGLGDKVPGHRPPEVRQHIGDPAAGARMRGHPGNGHGGMSAEIAQQLGSNVARAAKNAHPQLVLCWIRHFTFCELSLVLRRVFAPGAPVEP